MNDEAYASQYVDHRIGYDPPGPRLCVDMLIRHALGHRHHFGERINAPLLPLAAGDVALKRM